MTRYKLVCRNVMKKIHFNGQKKSSQEKVENPGKIIKEDTSQGNKASDLLTE